MGLTPELQVSDFDAPVKATAEWRVPPSAAERLSDSPWETVYLRTFAWFFLLAGVIYYFMIARRFEGDAAVTQHIEVLAMIVFAQLALAFLYDRLSNRIDLGTGLRRLQAKVANDSAVPVEVRLCQDGVVTGYDEGFLWLEDGTLYFKGLQTVFRLNAEDVPQIIAWPRRRRPNLDAGRLPRYIPLLGGARKTELILRLLDPFEDHTARRRTAAFDRSLTEWLYKKPHGSLESRLPPTDLHPSLVAGSNFRWEGLVAGTALTVMNLGLLVTARWSLGSSDMTALSNVLELGVGFFLLWLSARLAYRQWRDIRIRRELADEAARLSAAS